jgi:hypothetical protein
MLLIGFSLILQLIQITISNELMLIGFLKLLIILTVRLLLTITKLNHYSGMSRILLLVSMGYLPGFFGSVLLNSLLLLRVYLLFRFKLAKFPANGY